ncbi:OmpA family protein [bacterium]|nr:OmpA family protein [bacterium]
MTFVRPGIAVLLALLFAPAGTFGQGYLPAGDSVHERLIEFSAFSGWQMLDPDIDYASGAPLFGVRGTINNSEWWSFEGRLALSPGNTREIARGMLSSFSAHPIYNNQGTFAGVLITELETNEFIEESGSQLLVAGGNMLFHMTNGRWRPFFTVGGGIIDDLSNRNGDPRAPLSDPYLEFGLGLKYLKPSGWGVRLDVTDLFTRKGNVARENGRAALIAAEATALSLSADTWLSGDTRDVEVDVPYSPVDYRGRRWLNNIGVTLSVSMPFGFAWKDGDGDGIETRFDDCPTTAPGVVVDALGCGIDSDKDGVFDGLDQCADTPLGALVDIGGCPSDSDGDGVFDGIDVADDTPPGALVDEVGQHYDTDGDGVLDGLDLCNDTPLGATINMDGCVEDPVEDAFLRGQAIVVQDIRFERGTGEIDPLSYHHINKVARLIEHWTGNEDRPLRVELGVFTDGVGSDATNLELSRQRAENVRIYLLENFFGMGANNLIAKGYGETKPIAGDETAAGRAQNDRLEIRFTGEGAPPEEYDFGASEEDAFLDDEDFFGTGSGTASGGAGDAAGSADLGEDVVIPPPPPPIEAPDLDDDLDLSNEPETPRR